jgi:hypothetical protein
VLDDLTEKCPPAEACRDAFVRMSKASIKMCLSTTGFGNRGGFGNQQSQTSSLNAATADFANQNLNPNAPYFIQKTNAGNALQRRKPEFDYDLRDLFSDEESLARPFIRYNNMPKMSPAQRQSLNIPQQMPILKAESSNVAIGPQQFPAYPQQASRTSSALTSPVMATNYPQQPSPTAYGANVPNSNTYSSFANQISSQYPGMSPFSDLDFLDTFPLGPDARQGSTDPGQLGTDPALADFNMDFGIGWDGSLPAVGYGDEGGGVDLFDGFFFGGQQG